MRPGISAAAPHLRVITPREWKALKGRPLEKRGEPPELIVLTNTRSPACLDAEGCRTAVRVLQEQHMRQGLPDIRHNFLIGGDGNVYEGRGWKNKCEPYTDIDEDVVDFAFIEDFPIEEEQPHHNKMIRIGLELITSGIHQRLVQPQYEVIERFFYGFESSTPNSPHKWKRTIVVCVASLVYFYLKISFIRSYWVRYYASRKTVGNQSESNE